MPLHPFHAFVPEGERILEIARPVGHFGDVVVGRRDQHFCILRELLALVPDQLNRWMRTFYSFSSYFL